MIHKYNYLEWLKSGGLQPRTIEEYGNYLRNLINECKKFDQPNVDLFIAKHPSNVSRSFLRSYKNYLLRNPASIGITEEHTQKIRAIEIDTVKNRERKSPTILSEDEVMAIFRKMPDNEGKLLLVISFYCGLRRSELLALQYGDFNLNKWYEHPEGMGILTLVGKGDKLRKVPVTSKVMKRIMEGIPDNAIETTPMFSDMGARRWARILSRAGNKALGRHVKPHTLRHSIAMHLRGEGFAIDEIKEFLGHESISTTQIYSRVTPEQLMNKFRNL